jgi:hypothetical protein
MKLCDSSCYLINLQVEIYGRIVPALGAVKSRELINMKLPNNMNLYSYIVVEDT